MVPLQRRTGDMGCQPQNLIARSPTVDLPVVIDLPEELIALLGSVVSTGILRIGHRRCLLCAAPGDEVRASPVSVVAVGSR